MTSACFNNNVPSSINLLVVVFLFIINSTQGILTGPPESCIMKYFVVGCVKQCYIGALEVYENPRTLTMLDLMEVNTYKLLDCDQAHHPKETVQ